MSSTTKFTIQNTVGFDEKDTICSAPNRRNF